jgi:hypothetical protein
MASRVSIAALPRPLDCNDLVMNRLLTQMTASAGLSRLSLSASGCVVSRPICPTGMNGFLVGASGAPMSVVQVSNKGVLCYFERQYRERAAMGPNLTLGLM